MGRNPRQTVSRALRKLSENLNKRSGAFAGFNGISKKRKKRR